MRLALLEAAALLFAADAEPELHHMHSAADQHALKLRCILHELLVLRVGAKTHHALHTSAVVPAAVKQHDLAGRGQVLHIALKVPLPLLGGRRFFQRHHARATGVQVLHETLDGAALACRITAFKNDEHALARLFHPGLQLEQLHLQSELVLFIDRAAQQVGIGVAAVLPVLAQLFIGIGFGRGLVAPQPVERLAQGLLVFGV